MREHAQSCLTKLNSGYDRCAPWISWILVTCIFTSKTQVFLRVFNGSLCRAERSPDFKIVMNISSFVLSGQLKVILLTLCSFSLYVEFLEVVPANGLTCLAIERFHLFITKIDELVLKHLISCLMILRVHYSQHFVVVRICIKLQWVLVMRK